ncbi:3-deoxy-manno-octulosonate cytidylyltransferase [Candidatus Pelagibacter bacterium]|nr:3-deoxy-manno-octulosonate cytidylyltransferase [Candidatus Pelagibacter bacterium]MDA9625000.1 3-deoxy-manno-octulosonate cytidylyltransferase [Candidatus Pelagibacter bacterium]
MNKIAIIIPSRLHARRLPNKPLKLINNKEMILHVHDAAIKSKVGKVYVATPDLEIIDTINKAGGNAIMTSNNHKTGTDRIFEVFEKTLNSEPDIIINLQGDMPNIQSKAISDLVAYMEKSKCDIGTLASEINSEEELKDLNVVKVAIKNKLSPDTFLRALDFLRVTNNSKDNLYHHIGIYAFTNKALMRYVSLKRSKLELERNLEQLRALENNMLIDVGFVKSFPLSVDTEKDLIEVKKIMEKY